MLLSSRLSSRTSPGRSGGNATRRERSPGIWGTTNQRVRRFKLQPVVFVFRHGSEASGTCRRRTVGSSRGVAAGHSAAGIAAGLSLASSAASREARPHGGRGQYCLEAENQWAVIQANRPKSERLDADSMLMIVVAFKLAYAAIVQYDLSE